jgi:hypothetical protein
VSRYLTIYYAPNLPLYTLSLYKGLRSLGLLGCPTLCAVFPFPNWEQLRATPILPLCASDLIGRKSSSHSRPIGRTILVAQIACTRAGVPKPGWSKIPEASIPVSILSVSESELVSADRIDT